MLVIIDFDGTITERDLTDLVWDDYLPAEERRAMVEAVTARRITMVEFIGRGYAWVPKPPGELVRELAARVRIRRGFVELVERARASGWTLEIVSCGLDFYIREFLPTDVHFQSFVARHDGSYRVELPAGVSLEPGEEYKPRCVRSLRRAHPAEMAVYVGDGRADFEPATLCDRILAVRGSRLARFCQSAGTAFTPFDTFDEVVAAVERA
jgi:HAD superfamily phosphoserine phosphatase-like hydrolase